MNYNHHMSEAQHKENYEQMNYLEEIEYRNDYLYQQLQEEYDKYLLENNTAPKSFIDWCHTELWPSTNDDLPF